jgi:dTDP-4-dehydrorhamnose reductase
MAGRGEPLRVVGDEWGNPTPVPSLADRIASLLLSDLATLPSIVHLAGEPPTSRLDWARHVLQDHSVTVEPIPSAAYERPSRVPRRAVLSTARSAELGLPPIGWQDKTDR